MLVSIPSLGQVAKLFIQQQQPKIDMEKILGFVRIQNQRHAVSPIGKKGHCHIDNFLKYVAGTPQAQAHRDGVGPKCISYCTSLSTRLASVTTMYFTHVMLLKFKILVKSAENLISFSLKCKIRNWSACCTMYYKYRARMTQTIGKKKTILTRCNENTISLTQIIENDLFLLVVNVPSKTLTEMVTNLACLNRNKVL